MLYYRCNGKYASCGKRFNCLDFTKLPKTKLTPGQLRLLTTQYGDLSNVSPPSVDDLAGSCSAGRVQTERIVNSLRAAEVKAAKAANRRGKISGDVEIDEAGIRLVYVSVNNPHYKHMAPRLRKGERLPKYWMTYVRVIGLRQRGGSHTYLAMLPVKLLRPNARPPPLANDELLESGLLDRCRKGTVVFSDGAQAYPSVIKAHYRGVLLSRNVAHNRKEYTRRVRTPAGHSSLAGTMSIDAVWKSLKASIPSQLKSKTNKKINPLFEDYIWSWLYRHNNSSATGAAHLGPLFR